MPVGLQAQFVPADKELAHKVKECKLAVVFLEEDEKMVQYFTKKEPEGLEKYQTVVSEFNTFLKEAIEEEWNISKKIEFVTSSQVEHLRSSKDPDYCILEVTKQKNYKMNDFYSSNPRYGFNSLSDWSYHRSFVGKSSMLKLSWAGNPKQEIALSYVPEVGIPRVGIRFMVQHLENQIVDCVDHEIAKVKALKKSVEVRGESIGQKTVLLYDYIIGKPLKKQIEKGKLEKFYQYPLEVVDSLKLENIVVNHRDGYAYPIIVPAGAENHGKELYNYFFVDSADGRILSMTGMSGGENGAINIYHLYKLNKEAK
ncbi:hypothetical protein [Tunicatimonas pelagia]|uniref:hypothetical protein n=1 Tax=Tunicatimonas pelagia TaxID=931531 RepID=UPI00266562A9|nr:hypothetical protein [Tunicatimonas pelagia]WKN40611.1 hypothetical protein P0M28_16355 [Tunicatimonas pelagia]